MSEFCEAKETVAPNLGFGKNSPVDCFVAT